MRALTALTAAIQIRIYSEISNKFSLLLGFEPKLPRWEVPDLPMSRDASLLGPNIILLKRMTGWQTLPP